MPEEKPKNRVVESMTRIRTSRWKVRVWRTEEAPYSWKWDNNDIINLGNRILSSHTPLEIGEMIEQLPRIAAYEILDRDECGVVVYPDWS